MGINMLLGVQKICNPRPSQRIGEVSENVGNLIGGKYSIFKAVLKY